MWCSSWSLSGWSRVTLAAARDPAVPRPITAILVRDLAPGCITAHELKKIRSIAGHRVPGCVRCTKQAEEILTPSQKLKVKSTPRKLSRRPS